MSRINFGLRVQDHALRVEGLGFRVYKSCIGNMGQGLGFRGKGVWFGTYGLHFKNIGLMIWV